MWYYTDNFMDRNKIYLLLIIFLAQFHNSLGNDEIEAFKSVILQRVDLQDSIITDLKTKTEQQEIELNQTKAELSQQKIELKQTKHDLNQLKLETQVAKLVTAPKDCGEVAKLGINTSLSKGV